MKSVACAPPQCRPKVKLGEGAHGVVYGAESRQLGGKIAIKVFSTKRRMQQEVEILKNFEQLKVPNIIPLLHRWEQSFAMTFAEGGDLFVWNETSHKVLERLQVARSVVQQILQSLCVMHKNGWTHGDLKPENILFLKPFVFSDVSSWTVVICDFGFTKHIDDAPFTGRSGTDEYFDPAELEPDACLDFEQRKLKDIWTLGILCHEICFSEMPKFERNLCVFPFDIPPQIKGFIESCFRIHGLHPQVELLSQHEWFQQPNSF